LLKYALASATNQDFTDYEIIVSDNNSSDTTRVVIEAAMAATPRVKYFNPGVDLSMCDNWENALAKSTGTYILLLCDDDVLPRSSLSHIHELVTGLPAEILVWRYGSYCFEDFPDENERQRFTFPYASGQCFEVASQAMIGALLKFDWSVNALVPKMLNCAVSRKAIDVCRRRTGNFFQPPYPDFSATGQLLATNTSYHLVDLPLYVSGASGLSNAAFIMNRKRVFDDYLSLYGRDLLDGVPYPMRYLCTSYFHAGWRLLQQIYPDIFQGEIDLTAYLRAAFKELALFEDHEDVSGEIAQVGTYLREVSGNDEIFNDLKREHDKERNKTLSERRLPAGLKERAWSMARRNPGLYRTLAMLRGHRVTEASYRGVRTILEAASILEKYLAKSARSVRPLPPVQVDSLESLEATPAFGGGTE
jgi:glycosyltransferase involved in cell wall biosynthesis